MGGFRVVAKPWAVVQQLARARLQRMGRDLKPGEENAELRIWRCSHCCEVKPWTNGGGGGSALPFEVDEEQHLLDCCDDCWCAIVPVMEDAYQRAGLWKPL